MFEFGRRLVARLQALKLIDCATIVERLGSALTELLLVVTRQLEMAPIRTNDDSDLLFFLIYVVRYLL